MAPAPPPRHDAAMDATTLPAAAAVDTPMVINCVAYSADGRRLRDITIEEISDVIATPDQWVWVGLHEPTEALLDTLQEEFGLHELAVEDAHKAHQRAKIEVYGDSLFLVAQTAQVVGGRIAFGETHAFLGRNYLLTVRHGASLSYAAARRGCEQTPEMLASGPSYGLYSVLDFIVDNFFPLVSAFREELQELEEEVFQETFQRGTIRRLYDLKKELVALRLAVAPLQDILNQLIRQYPVLVRDEVRPYFRDVFDHAARINEATDTMREMLTAALSVNLALVTVAQGEVVKRLAGWAALLAAPTLITSWYGMNFRHMPELDGTWAYPAMMAGTLAVCGTLFVVLRRARWL
jgi:magnesium transporter